MKTVLLGLLVALSGSPVASEEWRLIEDDWTSRTTGAVRVDSITGPPTRRLVSVVAWSQSLGTDLYAVQSMAVDCEVRQTTIISVDMLNASGDLEFTLDADDLVAVPSPLDAASPTAAKLICDGVPMTSRVFGSTREFFDWVVEKRPA